MRYSVLLPAVMVLCGALVILETFPLAQAQENAPVVDGELPAPASAELPDELRDTAFDRYVDLHTLGEAIREANAALVADIALQLAEGERIMLRAHKAISAKSAFTLAIKMAGANGDNSTLARLKEYAQRSGNQALAAQIAQAQALGGARRAVDPLFQVSAEHATLAQFAFLQRIARALEASRITGEASELAALIEEVKAAPPELLSQDRKTSLVKRLQEASATKTATDGSDVRDLLAKLGETSRPVFRPQPGKEKPATLPEVDRRLSLLQDRVQRLEINTNVTGMPNRFLRLEATVDVLQRQVKAMLQKGIK